MGREIVGATGQTGQGWLVALERLPNKMSVLDFTISSKSIKDAIVYMNAEAGVGSMSPWRVGGGFGIRARKNGHQGWLGHIAAMDFLVVPTASFKLLYVWFTCGSQSDMAQRTPRVSNCHASAAFIISTSGSEPRDWGRLQISGVEEITPDEY
jgi:hypothetical protein